MKKLTLLLLLVSALFVQCRKDHSFQNNGQTNTNPDPVTATLQGRVLDENGQAATGARVQVGNAAVLTDGRGFFRITGATLDKNVSLVSVEKSGYFKAFRSFGAGTGANWVEIKLTKRVLAGSIDAAAGGAVSLSNGARISLPANGVVQVNGGLAYTGAVRVYASYIDPTASDIRQTVPGSLMADDAQGKRVLLNSYGMMAVELESTAGTKLQVKSGSEATLTVPIPSAQQASAPASIPLWFVDETKGLWKEEGSATRQGNNYIGNVKHFTYWNCDIPLPTVPFTVRLLDPAGQPLVNVPVSITLASGASYASAHGYTDSLGRVNGTVPANENLVLKVLDPCGNSVFTQNIGPYSAATDLGTVTTSLSGASTLLFKGKLIDCAGGAVSNGYAIVYYNNSARYVQADNTGNFQTSFLSCASSGTTVDVIPVNNTAQQQGQLQQVPATLPITNAGNLTACGSSSAQFFNYTLDGTDYAITSGTGGQLYVAPDSLGVSNNGIYAYDQSNQHMVNLNFTGTGTGNHPVVYMSVNQYVSNNVMIAPFNVNVTAFPQSQGGFMEGTLTGQFKDGQNVTHSISGTFRVRKL